MTFESVVINKPSGASEPEGHQQAMIDKIDGVNTPEVPEVGTPAERPTWLPEKFKTVEEMAKAYSELETKQSQGTPAEPAAATPVETPPVAPEAELKSKGLDMAEFSGEFNKTGTLSEESYAKLLAAGYDKGLVDSYITGQQAVAAQYDNTILAAAGGSEAYSEMVSWAKIAMTPAEQGAYNAAISSGNLAQATLAVAGLQSKFTADHGTEPKLLGGRTTTQSQDVFESVAQVTEAMKDPRYQKDHAYRAKVQEKLGRSDVI
jgi:hypothetical protein